MYKITLTVSGTNTAAFLEVLLKGHPAVQSVVKEDVKRTPFNNQMIGIVADRFGLSVCYVSQWLNDNNITSVEEAIEKTSIGGMADFLWEAFLDAE